MFRIAEESYNRHEHGDVLAVLPTVNCLEAIIALAKAADVTLFPGSWGKEFYLQLPGYLEQNEAMFQLATELGLTWVEIVYDPWDPDDIDWG